MPELMNALLRGIETGSIYAIIALGLNLVFSTTGVFNFAQGDIWSFGVIAGVISWQSFHIPIGVTFVLVVVTAAAIGAIVERVAVRSVQRAGAATSSWVISTLGVSVIASSIMTWILTRRAGSTGVRTFPSFLPNAEARRAGGIIVEPERLFVVAVMIMLTAAVALFMRRTNHGRALRAVADDRIGAAMRGLPVARLSIIAFSTAAAICAFGAMAAGPVTQAVAGGGLALTVSGFTAATIGGIPSLIGAAVGGWILGITEQLTALYTNGNLTSVVALALLLVVLTFRPSGLFGAKARDV